MFPKTGKVFPDMEKRIIPKSKYAEVIGEALENEYRKNDVNMLKRLLRVSGRSIKNWKMGNNMPSAENLIMLMGHSNEILNACLYLAGRPHIIPMVRFMDMVLLIKEPIDTIEYMWRMTQPEYNGR